MEFFGQQFEQVIMWDIMDHIKDKLGNEKMNLDDPDTVNKVKEAIMDVVKKQKDIAESEREGVVEGMVGALTNYSNADLNQPGVKYVISK
jgi:predicted small metal-binding protein